MSILKWNYLSIFTKVKSERKHTVITRNLFILLSKLGIGERRSIDIGLTSQPRTITYPHTFFLSNSPPYLKIGLGMFISPAIGVFRWVEIPTGHSTKITCFATCIIHTLAKDFNLGSRPDLHHSAWQHITFGTCMSYYGFIILNNWFDFHSLSCRVLASPHHLGNHANDSQVLPSHLTALYQFSLCVIYCRVKDYIKFQVESSKESMTKYYHFKTPSKSEISIMVHYIN